MGQLTHLVELDLAITNKYNSKSIKRYSKLDLIANLGGINEQLTNTGCHIDAMDVAPTEFLEYVAANVVVQQSNDDATATVDSVKQNC